MYYRLGKLDDAIAWYEKAINLDPRREVAYRNLGDLYYQLDRMSDARRIYEKFLEIAPSSAYAPTVRTRLGN
jgi:tetratricopeptide (TPR) repeat protein